MKFKNKYLNETFNILCMIVGVVFMGIAFNSFFYANNIAPGGFSGLAQVISDFFISMDWFYVSPTILYLILNAFLIFFAFKTLGLKYFLYSLLGIGAYALCIEFLNINLNFNDMFLATIFGALFMGIGTGLVVRAGGSTGGGEMLGKILHSFNSEITVGKIIIVVDTIVVLLSLATYGLVNSLYTLIAIYLMGKITDMVIEGGKGTKAYYIISDKHEEIADVILHKLYRGATIIDGKGVYSKNEKKILMCLLNKYEARNLKNLVFEIDDKAFLFSTSVVEAYGEGFDKKVKYSKMFEFKKYKNKKNKNLDDIKTADINSNNVKNEKSLENKNEDNLTN